MALPPPSDSASVRWGEPLKLLPLLGLFAIAAWAGAAGDFDGDGWRYLQNARNLMHGGFAGPETLMFWNGPGYPLFILPWVALGAPLALARLANAAVLYLAVAHCQGALRALGLRRRSLLYAYAIGLLLFLHGPLLGSLMSESLAAYCACGAAWHYARSAAGPRPRRHLVLAGLHLGGLALTKVFFGYVLEAGLIAALIGWALLRRAPEAARAARRGACACVVGLLFCVPWLAYTWSQTGKAHLWSNSGGWQAWYFSWPEKEYRGDWLNWQAVLEHEGYFKPHMDELRAVLRLDPVAQDSTLKAWSRANCRAHPGACLTHWRANVNRMVFGYPVTAYAGGGAELATGNRSFVYALPFFLFAAALVPGWLGRRALRPEAHGILAMAAIALGGTSLLSAIPRQVFPMLPWMMLWCALVAEQALRIEGRWGERGNAPVSPGEVRP
jgi:hypothetical protein